LGFPTIPSKEKLNPSLDAEKKKGIKEVKDKRKKA
jgi:hypothetical protein